MATPIKSLLLNSRVSSPIHLKNVILSPQNRLVLNSLSPKSSRHGTVTRRSLFQKNSPSKSRRDFQGEIFKFTVTDYGNKSEERIRGSPVLINTPNKLEILKNGLGSKEKLSVLGRGGFGTVVKGIYQDKIVAVKVKKLPKSSDFPGESNFLGLKHENLINIVDVILRKTENYCLIIMDYFEDSTHLQRLLDDPKIGINHVEMAGNISQGVKFIHENKILHLDLKPSNILVCRGICKLCDFGNSATVSGSDYNFQGTVSYADPEILLGKPPTYKSDIYSLGITFWQLKNRTLPYAELQNSEIIIYKVVKYSLRPQSHEPCDLFEKLYADCWESRPQNRPTIHEVCQKLQEIQM